MNRAHSISNGDRSGHAGGDRPGQSEECHGVRLPVRDGSVPETPLRVLLIAPYYDQGAVGEGWSTYKWVQGISQRCEVVVLTTHNHQWVPERSPTQARQIVNWTDPAVPRVLAGLNRGVKPTYILFYWRVRKWLKTHLAAGGGFDLIHQINPLALRYPCPAAGLGLKYMIGPLAGSLETPEELVSECDGEPWFRKLRNLDRIRLRLDPWLRKTYSEASAVVGVAPYVGDLLAGSGLQRFELMSETGVDRVTESPRSPSSGGSPLRLLFVGRIIRTKGILDAIRAVAMASKKCQVELDVVGDGELSTECRQEAARLGITPIVRFHGRQPRESLPGWYAGAHVFLFPSFREPSGNVVFEAMASGLPLITSTVGGPGHVVNDACGIRIRPAQPARYASEIAAAILRLESDRGLIARMSIGAVQRARELGLWDRKLDRLMELYRELAGPNVAGSFRGV